MLQEITALLSEVLVAPNGMPSARDGPKSCRLWLGYDSSETKGVSHFAGAGPIARLRNGQPRQRVQNRYRAKTKDLRQGSTAWLVMNRSSTALRSKTRNLQRRRLLLQAEQATHVAFIGLDAWLAIGIHAH